MTDILPYSFEPEHGAVDYPSSTDSEEDTRDSGDEAGYGVDMAERVDNSDWCTCGKYAK